jgi:hypothetical protein
VAAAVKQAIGVEPEVKVGDRGEFTVWVDDRQVAQKGHSDEEMVDAVRNATNT